MHLETDENETQREEMILREGDMIVEQSLSRQDRMGYGGPATE